MILGDDASAAEPHRHCRIVEDEDKSIALAFQWSTSLRALDHVNAADHLIHCAESQSSPSFANVFRYEEEKVYDIFRGPPNFFRNTGSCVAMPTGQVLRWHLRIMMQPMAIRGVVEKPNSSAPSNAAITTSRPVCNLPSVWTRMRLRRSFITSTCCVSARPSSHGMPACLIDDERRRTCSPVIAAYQNRVRMGFCNACGNGPDTIFCDELYGNTRSRIDVFQIVNQLREIFDGIDVVMGWGRNQPDAGNGMRRVRSQHPPCVPAVVLLRRASRPAQS